MTCWPLSKGLIFLVCVFCIVVLIIVSLFSSSISQIDLHRHDLSFMIFNTTQEVFPINSAILQSCLKLDLFLIILYIIWQTFTELNRLFLCLKTGGLFLLLCWSFLSPATFLTVVAVVFFLFAESFVVVGSIVMLDLTFSLQRSLRRANSENLFYLALVSSVLFLVLFTTSFAYLSHLSLIIAIIQACLCILPVLLSCFFSSVVSVNWAALSVIAAVGSSYLVCPLYFALPEIAAVAISMFCNFLLLIRAAVVVGSKDNSLFRAMEIIMICDTSYCNHSNRVLPDSPIPYTEIPSSSSEGEGFNGFEGESGASQSRPWSKHLASLLLLSISFIAYNATFSLKRIDVEGESQLWRWLEVTAWLAHWSIFYLSYYQRNRLYQIYLQLKGEPEQLSIETRQSPSFVV